MAKEVCNVKATPAKDAPTNNCITTIHHRFVFNISTTGLQKGLMTHGKYNQLVYKAISVFDNPKRLYITAAMDITTTYGIPSAKYKDGTQAQGERFEHLF